MQCNCLRSENNFQYICLSPLCLQRLKPLCDSCASSLSHENHQVVNIKSIFKMRSETVENTIKHYILNIIKLEEQKQNYTKIFQNIIKDINTYMNELIESIDRQISVQGQMIEEIRRVELIASYHYEQQLKSPSYPIVNDIQRLLCQTSVCPQFEITNLIQQAEKFIKLYQQNTNKNQQFEEIGNCLNKNLLERNFSTKESEDLLEQIKNVDNILEYNNLQAELQNSNLERKPLISYYCKDNKEVRCNLSSFSEEIIHLIKQRNTHSHFDTLLPSKIFYDASNFQLIMNKYFSKGGTLINMQLRQSDEIFFKIPPFLQNYTFKSLLNLSVNINSTEFKSLIYFIQNHPQIQSLDVLLNADQSLLSTTNLKFLFSSNTLPNIKNLKIDITRLNFSSSIAINEIQGYTEPIQKFLQDKKNSLQSFQIDGLWEFQYNFSQMSSVLFGDKKDPLNHLKKLTFLVVDIDLQLNDEKIFMDNLHNAILKQMPLLVQIKLYKITEYLDVERFFNLLNKQLKQRSLMIKMLTIIKSRLKFYRKENITTIIQEFISSLSQMIDTN